MGAAEAGESKEKGELTTISGWSEGLDGGDDSSRSTESAEQKRQECECARQEGVQNKPEGSARQEGVQNKPEMSGDAEIAAKPGREDERAPASSSVSSGWVGPSLPESSLWIVRRAAKSIRRGVVRASARERAHAAALREAGTEDIESGRSWLLLLASFA